MESQSKKSLSEALHGNHMPPPPTGRALALGAGAAIAGTAVWGMVAYYGNVEVGYIAIGIGALIGFAMVKAGGHGMLLTVSAGVLALLSIASGKHLSFTLTLTGRAEENCTPEDFAEFQKDAADWEQLGDSATAEDIERFAANHGYSPLPADQFRAAQGSRLDWFAADERTLDEWRAWEIKDDSFVDHLKEDFHPYDILFAVIGIAAAAGQLKRRTDELEARNKAALLAERQAARDAASSDTAGDDSATTGENN